MSTSVYSKCEVEKNCLFFSHFYPNLIFFKKNLGSLVNRRQQGEAGGGQTGLGARAPVPRRRHAVGVDGDGPLGCVFLGTAQGREHDRDQNTHVPLARGFFFSFLSFFKPVTCCLSPWGAQRWRERCFPDGSLTPRRQPVFCVDFESAVVTATTARRPL